MEILYRVDKMTFKDRESAERYERGYRDSLVARKNAYKHFYLPVAFEHYKKSIEKVKAERKVFRMKSFTRVSELYVACEDMFEKKRILRERIAEYRNTKALIKQLSTAEKIQTNKKTESKK